MTQIFYEHFRSDLDADIAADLFKSNVKSVDIAISNFCNRSCFYCPNSKIDRRSTKNVMDDDIFLNIMRQLGSIDYSGLIHINRYNEPLADKSYVLKRISEIKSYIPDAEVVIYSNGDYWTADLIEELSETGVSRLIGTIHTLRADSSMEPVLHRQEACLNRLGFPFSFLPGDRTGGRVADIDAGNCMTVQLIARNVNYRSADGVSVLLDRGQSLEIDTKYWRSCPCLTTFEQLHIEWDGTVLPCCNIQINFPAHEKYILGQIKPDSNIFLVWANPNFVAWRKRLFNYKLKTAPCTSCFTDCVADTPELREFVEKTRLDFFEDGSDNSVSLTRNDAIGREDVEKERQMVSVEIEYGRGMQLYGAGRFAEAETVFRTCLEKEPRNPDLLNALSSVTEVLNGSLDEAVLYLEQACSLRPDSAVFRYNLANLLRRKGESERAEREYLAAIDRSPEFAEAYHGLGSLYLNLGRHSPAEACLERAVALMPDRAVFVHDLGQSCQLRGCQEKAEQLFRRSIDCAPGFVPAINSLGMLLLRQNRIEESRECFLRAISIDSGYLQARCNLAVLSTWSGELDFAIGELRNAVKAAPEDGDIHFNLSLALLAAGMMKEGCQEHEWRFRKGNPVQLRHARIPRWNGEPLTGKRILIHAEQGYGDSIQFIRYAAVLADLGGIVFVEGQDGAITPLLKTVPGVKAAFARGDELPDVDLQIPMMSLPLPLEKLAWPPPVGIYLYPPDDLVAVWQKRLAGLPGFKVGLAWAGRPEHENNANRSIAPGSLTVLGLVQDVSYVSLQFDPRGVAELPFKAYDFFHEVEDFCDSAALVRNLDLVVTIDSAIAHLAGGLGVPTLLLLPWNPDWRWMHGRKDSPWYPSIRIFRGTAGSSWAGVIEEVAGTLAVLARKTMGLCDEAI